MNEQELFEMGCFSPEWTTDMPQTQQSVRHRKDLHILLEELDEIKDQIQQIQAKRWHLAELLKFYSYNIAVE